MLHNKYNSFRLEHKVLFVCTIFMIWYDIIYLLTAIVLTPGGSSTVHIYTQTIHRTTQWNRIPRTAHT